eukprot:s143_g40.t2
MQSPDFLVLTATASQAAEVTKHLNSAQRIAMAEAEAASIPLCVFAKPPVPGRAKTRLAASIGNEAACRLATAFISDFISMAAGIDWAYPVLATTEDGMEGFPLEAYPPGVRPDDVPRWKQPEGDLGAKIEGIVRQALAGASVAWIESSAHQPQLGWDLLNCRIRSCRFIIAAICLGADSPGRPAERLEETRQALQDGFDAVLGPTEDGGYDVLALKQCPEGLLAELPWSQPSTFEATKVRLEERGLRVAVLPKWWDVDEVEDLERLRQLLQSEAAARAPATAAVMSSLDSEMR